MSGVNDGRLIDYDPTTGIREDYYEIDGQWYIVNKQDAEDIIELNKAEYNSTDERARHKSEVFNRCARLPLTVLMDLERRGITKDAKAFRKWLNASENRAFRTRPGTL